jgi:hypothetical protein
MVTGIMSSKSDRMVRQLLSPHTSPPQVPHQLVTHGQHRKVGESTPQPTLLQQLRPLPAGPVVTAAMAVAVTAAAAAIAVVGLEAETLDLLQPNPQPIDQTTPPPTLPLPPHRPLPTVVLILVPTPTRNLTGRTTLPPTELLEQLLPLMDPMSSDLLEVVVNRVVLAPTPTPVPTQAQIRDPLLLHQVPTLPRPALIQDRALTLAPIPATLATALHQAHGLVNRNPTGQTLHLPTFPIPSSLHLLSRNLERASAHPTPLLKLLKLLRPRHPLPNQHQHLRKDTLVPSLFLPISLVPVRLHPLL